MPNYRPDSCEHPCSSDRLSSYTSVPKSITFVKVLEILRWPELARYTTAALGDLEAVFTWGPGLVRCYTQTDLCSFPARAVSPNGTAASRVRDPIAAHTSRRAPGRSGGNTASAPVSLSRTRAPQQLDLRPDGCAKRCHGFSKGQHRAAVGDEVVGTMAEYMFAQAARRGLQGEPVALAAAWRTICMTW